MSIYVKENGKGRWNILCHERLSIQDPSDNGTQPFNYEDEGFVFVTNGEIYNVLELQEKFKSDKGYKSHSDSEAFTCLIREFKDDYTQLFQQPDGMWATVILDTEKNSFIVGRDHVGIIPAYIGVGKNDEIYVSNELKAIHDYCVSLEILKPGHFIKDGIEQQKWYSPKW